MKNPEKGVVVRAWWPSFARLVDAKWTGKRWLRFNELFGGYDPVEPPLRWELKHAEAKRVKEIAADTPDFS